MTTPILGIDEGADGQTSLYAVYNQGMRDLESAANKVAAVDLSSGNATLDQDEFAAGVLFDCQGHSVYRTVTLPSTQRVVCFRNSGSAPIGIILAAQTVYCRAGFNYWVVANNTVSPHLLTLLSSNEPAVLTVEDHLLALPPATSPLNAEGTIYIVAGGSPQGAWQGQTNDLATHIGGGSYFFTTPYDGQIVRSKNLSSSPQASTVLIYNATADSWDTV